jgi:hypothetical protein
MFGEQAVNLQGAVASHASEMERHVEALDTMLTGRAGELQNTLLTHSAAVDHALGQSQAGIDKMLGESVVDLQGAIASHASEVWRHVETLDKMLTDRAGELQNTLLTHSSAVDNVLGQGQAGIAKMFGESVASLQGAVSAHAVEVGHHVEALDTMLNGRTSELQNALLIHSAAVDSALGQSQAGIGKMLGMRAADIERTLGQRSNEINSALETHTGALQNALNVSTERLDQTLGARAEEIAQTLQNRSEEIESVLSGNVQAMHNSLTSNVGTMGTVLGTGIAALDRSLGTHATTMAQTLRDRSQEIGTALDGNATSLRDTLETAVQTLNGLLESGSGGLIQTLQSGTQQIDDSLTAHLGTVRDVLTVAVRDFDGSLGSRAQEVNQAIGSRLEELHSTLESRLAAITSALDERGRALHQTLATRTGELRDLLDHNGPILIDLLSSRGSEVAQELAEVGELVAQALENRGHVIVQHLGEKQTELTSSIDSSAQALRRSLDTGARTSVAALVGTSDTLKNDVGALLERLGSTNASLSHLIDAAGATLSGVDTALQGRLADFSQQLGQVAAQVDAINQTARASIGDAHAIAGSIEAHHQALADAAQALARTQAEVDAEIDGRQATLDALLANVNARVEEFDGMMRSFSGLVEDSLNRAEGRARDLGAFLADSAQATTGAISDHFETLRSSAGEERDRTASALRMVYDQSTSDMTELFGSAVEKFRTSADEIRQMASEVQHELDSARQDLHRSTIELPRETAEQAAEVRRVIDEQVKALQDLTFVIDRASNGNDVVEPPSARRGILGGGEAAAFAPASRAVRPAEPRTGGQLVPSRAQSRPAADPALNAEGGPRLPAAARSGPAPSEQGPGWLSDLLARASFDDIPEMPELPPASVPTRIATSAAGSLAGLSFDIARLIDEPAAAEAWGRFRRGESRAFGRNIYTAQGQQTFEEVRRRYRSDPEFAETVNRYTKEFERLLAEVNRGDQDGTVTRRYLGSEAGKVYTLLAHAVGRLN